MQGVRHWVGRFSGNFLSAGGIAVDTQMALVVPDPGTIIVPPFIIGPASYGTCTLRLASIDTIGKLLTFYDCSYIPIWVRYFYDVDSIVYQNSVQSTVGHFYENDFLQTVK